MTSAAHSTTRLVSLHACMPSAAMPRARREDPPVGLCVSGAFTLFVRLFIAHPKES